MAVFPDDRGPLAGRQPPSPIPPSQAPNRSGRSSRSRPTSAWSTASWAASSASPRSPSTRRHSATSIARCRPTSTANAPRSPSRASRTNAASSITR